MKRNDFLVDFILRPFVEIIARVFFRLKVSNRGSIPRSGGIILAGNHISDWDPPFVGASIPRGVHFMAKSELFRIPVVGLFLKMLGAFPVYRSATVNTDALRTAIELLKEGRAVIIFPEGTRSRGGRMLRPKPGVGYIASAAGAPVHPFYVRGTDHPWKALFFMDRFRVDFGERIEPEELAAAHAEGGPSASAQYIMDRVKRIKETEGKETE